MLRKFTYAAVIIIGSATAGFTADLASQQQFYSPAPVYSWTGFYVGGIIGYAGADFNNNIPANPGPTGEDGGFTVGAQVGYNHQINQNWAIGIEADIATLNIEGSSTAGSFEEDWMATFRLRGGYTFSRYFVYATAGVAVTHKDATRTGVGSGDDTVAGFTGGLGVEAKFNQKWSTKLEYLYVNVPDDAISTGGTPIIGGSHNHIARIGINYHF